MYYNNHHYLAQLQSSGLALNKALRTQTMLLCGLIVCGAATLYFALAWQKQKALMTKAQQKSATEE